MKKKCPCCGYLTIESEETIITEICKVCFWQYDEIAHKTPDRSIGANHISLNEARANFKKYGACLEKFKTKTREPEKDELP